MRKLKKIGAALLAATMAVGMLSGCGGGSGSSDSGSGSASGDGNTLNFGCFVYSNNFDPAIDQNSAWMCMRLGIGEGLFKFDEEMVPQYQLCDDYTTNEDLTEHVLHIRDGVKFSNGNDCDAQAVADSLNRLFTVTNSDNTLYGATASQYIDFASCEADTEANTVTIKTNTPAGNLDGSLSFPFYAIIDVEGDITDENHSDSKAPGYSPVDVVGTGPYDCVEFDDTTSNGKLVANEYYWNGDVPYDTINFIHYAEADKKAMSLQSGEIDLTENITTAQDLETLENDDAYYVSQATGVRSGFAYVNFDKVLGNDALRQAVMMAVDGQTMCDVTVGGMYTYGYAVLPSSLSYDYDKLNYKFGFDVEGAKKLLDDAGIKDTDGDGIREIDGENINLNYVTYVNRCLNDFAQAVQVGLKEIGVGCSVNVVDDQTLWDELEKADYDLCDVNWTTVGTGDPTDYMRNWYAGKDGANLFREGGNGANYCGYENEKYDAAFEKFLDSTDDAEKEELILEMEQILLDDAAVLVHGYYNSTMISNASKVTGAEIATIDYYWLSTAIKPAQ